MKTAKSKTKIFANKNRPGRGSKVALTATAILREEVLTPFEEFEVANNIRETRDDLPYAYLGTCPSKYYRTVDMNVKKLRKNVARDLKKLSF